MRITLTIFATLLAFAGFTGLAGTPQADAMPPRADSSYSYQEVEDATVSAVETLSGETVTDVEDTFNDYGLTSRDHDEVCTEVENNLDIGDEVQWYCPPIDNATLSDWASDVHTSLDG